MEEGEAKNPTESNGTPAPKRVPLSLEEMLERNKKEQEAVAKVCALMIVRRNNFVGFLAEILDETRTRS